jgi:hypothetical protein
MIAREQFLAAVKSLCGTPVVHRGRVAGPRGGVDCVGVPLVALALCGATVDMHADIYGMVPDSDQLEAGLARYCDRLDVAVAGPGDLLQVYHGRKPRHVMVWTGRTQAGQAMAVHAWGKGACVREVVVAESIAGAWRVRGVG